MKIPGYEIERKLGEGGMSTVYLAIQESLGRRVALKLMSEKLTQDPSFKARFYQEGRIVAKLNHPNIVTIYETGDTEDRYFIAMEYVAGKNLSEKIQQGMALEDCILTIKRIARALGYAHSRGFLHRDIKPTNILFRDDEFAVLADFGIARAAVGENTSLTQTGVSLGTPAYMSPEQARGETLDARSDQYSLGVVFYHILTGKPPYQGTNATATAVMHVTAPIPVLLEPYRVFQPILNRLLAKTPDERFSDEEALIRVLDEMSAKDHPDPVLRAHGQPQNNNATFLAKSTRRMPESNRLWFRRLASSRIGWWGIAASTSIVLVGLAIWLLRGPPPDPRIARLLSIAESQRAVERFVKPQGDNANDTYQGILAIDPDNRQALAGLKQMIDSIEELARVKWRENALEKSLILVEQGLQVDHQNEDLIALHKAILREKEATVLASKKDDVPSTTTPVILSSDEPSESNSLASGSDTQQETVTHSNEIVNASDERESPKPKPEDLAQTQVPAEQEIIVEPQLLEQVAIQETGNQAVEALLAKAKEQLTDFRFTQPQGNNAAESYRKVLALDADNQKAKAGLQKIARRYEKLALNKFHGGDPQAGMDLAERGLGVDAENPNLLALRHDIQDLLDKKEKRNKKIERLLATGQRQIKADRLTQPKGKNALETFQKILKIEPGNKKAKTGVETILQHYQEVGHAKQKDGDLAGALSMVEDGLKSFPSNTELLALRKDLQGKLEEASRVESQKALEPGATTPKQQPKRRVFGTF